MLLAIQYVVLHLVHRIFLATHGTARCPAVPSYSSNMKITEESLSAMQFKTKIAFNYRKTPELTF